MKAAINKMRQGKYIAASFICCSILLRTIAALCAKQAGLTSAHEGMRGILINPWYWGELAALVCHVLSWTIVLRTFPLSFAYPFISVTFLTVLWGSWFFFEEQIQAGHLLGIAIIISGVLTVASAKE